MFLLGIPNQSHRETNNHKSLPFSKIHALNENNHTLTNSQTSPTTQLTITQHQQHQQQEPLSSLIPTTTSSTTNHNKHIEVNSTQSNKGICMITSDVNKIKMNDKRDDDEKMESRKEILREQHRVEKVEVTFWFLKF